MKRRSICSLLVASALLLLGSSAGPGSAASSGPTAANGRIVASTVTVPFTFALDSPAPENHGCGASGTGTGYSYAVKFWLSQGSSTEALTFDQAQFDRVNGQTLVCDGSPHTYSIDFPSSHFTSGGATASGCVEQASEGSGGYTTYCTSAPVCTSAPGDCETERGEQAISLVAPARPPQLLSAAANGGEIALGWSLPDRTQSVHVGISTSSSTGPNGAFTGNVVVSENVAHDAHAFTSGSLPDGVYYAHVLDFDPDCGCDGWSNVLSVTVSTSPPPPPPPTTTSEVTTTAVTTTTPETTTSFTPPPQPPVPPARRVNKAPTLAWVDFTVSHGSERTVARFKVRVCDDTSVGKLRLVVRERLLRHGRRSTRTLVEPMSELKGCAIRTETWLVSTSARQSTVGSLRAHLVDAGGKWSNTVVVPAASD